MDHGEAREMNKLSHPLSGVGAVISLAVPPPSSSETQASHTLNNGSGEAEICNCMKEKSKGDLETSYSSGASNEGTVGSNTARAEAYARDEAFMARLNGLGAGGAPTSWNQADADTRSRLFEFAVEHANDPVVITTTALAEPGPQIVYVNRAFHELTGYTRDEAIGQTPRILQGPLTDRAEMKRMRREIEQGRSFIGQTINYRKDGSAYFMEWSVYGLFDDGGVLHFYVAVQRDISARKEYERRIEEQARELAATNRELERANTRLAALSLTDSLTGVANHRAFHARLGEELTRCKRIGLPLSVLLLDVDRFKTYNDSFGHPAGDEALQRIAIALQSHARATDLVARHGGEEFAVLLPHTDHKGALHIGETLRRAIEETSWPLRPVTVSVGTATTGPHDLSSSHLIDIADTALYRSKAAGRNCVS